MGRGTRSWLWLVLVHVGRLFDYTFYGLIVEGRYIQWKAFLVPHSPHLMLPDLWCGDIGKGKIDHTGVVARPRPRHVSERHDASLRYAWMPGPWTELGPVALLYAWSPFPLNDSYILTQRPRTYNVRQHQWLVRHLDFRCHLPGWIAGLQVCASRQR